MSDTAPRSWPLPLRPKAPAGRWPEPLLAAILCAGLGLLVAFDLSRAGANPMGNPTAVVILAAAIAGWALSLAWALPLWVLGAGVCALAAAIGDVPPLNAVAIAAAAMVAGVGSHVGGTALRNSLDALDRHIHLIRRASALVSGSSDTSAMLDEVLLATVEILGGPDDGAGLGVAALELGDGEPRLKAAVGRSPTPGGDLLADALRTPRRAVADASGRTCLARVDSAGEPWGVLVAGRGHGRFTARELQLLGAVAEFAGVAIDSRRRAADTARLRDRLQVTLELAVEIGASLDPTDVATGVLRRACAALDADRGMLARIRGDETDMVAVYDRRRGEPRAWAGDRFPTAVLLQQPHLREAIEGRRAVIGGALDASVADERYRDEASEVRAVLALPLLASGEAVGLLTLTRSRDAPFADDDRSTLRQFGSVAVLALMNSWAHAELERERRSAAETARQLRVAVEAAKDVGFETELDEVTRRLLARAAVAVGAERGSIGRIDGDRLIVEADWNGSAEPGPAGRMLSLAGVPGLLDMLRSGRSFRQSTAGAATDDGGEEARHLLQCPLMAGGELVGVMALSRGAAGPFDDAELEALQQLASLTALTLRSARQLAVARNLGQAKSEFLNMTAHELRTPLAVVRGYLSMMADGTLDVSDETRQSVIRVLCQKTDELSGMIEQILAAVHVQAGRVPVERHVFDLREAMAEALGRAQPRAAQAGVELWSEPLPEPVWVDAARTSVLRILDNLVGNAITYGNQLPVRVTVEVGRDVLLRVEDQGVGIAPDQQERLFEPFYRVDQPSIQGPAGAGLGLAVSRRLAELSGGSLELEWTQPGAGSTFVLRLPAPLDPVRPDWQGTPVQ